MRQWFKMKAADADTAEILIYDEIGKSFWGEDSVAAKDFLESLNALGDGVKNITLRINSPGGDVFDGVAIHNALKNHKANVTAYIDGIAASIASYIAMAANKIIMPSNAFMLIHNSAGFVFGNADDMRSLASDLERIDNSILATYANRSKTDADKLSAIMKEDRLMDAAEAKELGLADEVSKEVKMAAKFSLRLLPQAAAEKLRAVAKSETAEGDPPHPVSGSDAEPVVTEPPATVEPAASTTPPGQPAPVVDLKQQGIDEHKAYVGAVTDLCTLAGVPDKVGHYVRNATPVDEVRKDLINQRSQDVRPQHATPNGPAGRAAAATSWKAVTDKINARNQR